VTASDNGGRGAKQLIDQALDLFFYAPVGLVVSSLEDLTEVEVLAERGRTRIGRLLSNARVVGKLTVAVGRRSVESEISRWRPPDPNGRGGDDDGPNASPAPPQSRRRPQPAIEAPRRIGPDADLAIPGYETLSASQVVRRLDGLGLGELQAIYEHESVTKRRRTILHRTQQLLGHEDAPGPAGWPA
jgi:hypothetical protein